MRPGHRLRGVRIAFRILVVVACAPGPASAQHSVDAPIPHAVGQSVSPSFEGWYPNPDGTFSLLFGYFNRNYDEHVQIPVGAQNRIEPGPPDQGQPTYFLPRRQTGVFVTTVPADFGTRHLTWSVTAHGHTVAIPGHLRPEWEITPLREVTSGNTPPVVRFDPASDAGQGPFGVRTEIEAAVGTPVELAAWVVDDGVRKARAADRPPQLGVVWSTYRGPTGVSFRETEPTIAADDRAVTMATFDTPGDYVLRLLAWDDSGGQRAIMAGGFLCCWTNGYVAVRVR